MMRLGVDICGLSEVRWNKKRTEINRESTSMLWPTLGSRTAKEQNRTGLPVIFIKSGSSKLTLLPYKLHENAHTTFTFTVEISIRYIGLFHVFGYSLQTSKKLSHLI